MEAFPPFSLAGEPTASFTCEPVPGLEQLLDDEEAWSGHPRLSAAHNSGSFSGPSQSSSTFGSTAVCQGLQKDHVRDKESGKPSLSFKK